MFLKTRSKAIIHEFLDNEIILADLDAGIYYSIRGCGIQLWQQLVSGNSLEEAIDTIQRQYGKDNLDLCSAFAMQLCKEQLLIETTSMPHTTIASLSWPNSFEPPVLEKYEEMKNLLMLDPIHEVDEQGWPVREHSDLEEKKSDAMPSL